MAKRKAKKHIWQLNPVWIIALFGILSLGALSYTRAEKDAPLSTRTVLGTSMKKKQTVYPKLYSDTHITANAIIADPKYRNLSIFDRESLVASTISTIRKNPSPISQGPESGTWLWTPVLDITPQYRDSVIAGAKKNQINVVYLSIDSYLDIFSMEAGEEKTAAREKFEAIIDDFIATANRYGISVDAEAGWRNWGEVGHSYKAFAIMNFVKTYNRMHDNRFRGFQYDIEPYLLESYQDDKAIVLSNFLDVVAETISRLDNTDLSMSVVIPEFYDGTNDETPRFTYLGKEGFAIDHLLRIMQRRPQSSIVIMSYRNIGRGDDSAVDVSMDEITKADKTSVKIIVAQETGDVEPPYITFHKTSRAYLDKQLGVIRSDLDKNKSFGGIALHYVNAYLDLR